MTDTEDAPRPSYEELQRHCDALTHELNESSIRFELILEASNDGVWDWDLTRDEVMFSRRWKSILGYESDEVEDRSAAFFALIHPDDQAAVQAAVEEHLQRRVPYDVQFRMRDKSGGYREIRARGQATWAEDGTPLRMAGTHTDMTETNAQARERLKREELIELQRATIRSLGTPLLDLGEGVLCLPLIGAIDHDRAAEMTSAVLERVSRDGARALIVDLTAAVIADEAASARLLTLLRSVALLGARRSLCGLSPELARRLVEQGSTEQLKGVPVHRTLGAALRAALA
ncbi:MAG: PAS domain-containing protein [Myxococcales bacterium]|nr:PAS domain-containing protein [Myxococcales bacterium]MCB9753559.1 PAS domain-containing protein [Myxococcales bacterium]